MVFNAAQQYDAQLKVDGCVPPRTRHFTFCRRWRRCCSVLDVGARPLCVRSSEAKIFPAGACWAVPDALGRCIPAPADLRVRAHGIWWMQHAGQQLRAVVDRWLGGRPFR